MTFEIGVLMTAGLAFLTLGAEWLVRGSSRLASFFGISPLVTGLTIVAFGTSAPELAVSVKSAVNGTADIALGNVVGSNICNILLILGLAGMIVPLSVRQQLIRIDVPIMIGVSMLVYVFALNDRIDRSEGFVLFAGIVAYTIFLIRLEKREVPEIEKEYADEFEPKPPVTSAAAWRNAGLSVIGLVLLIVGADWMVNGAVQLARTIGISELVIGLTVIAVGTSLPEIATSIVAAIKGERDIAVGNVVGSNIFNLLSVLGISTIVSSDGIAVAPNAMAFDLPVMIAVAALCLPVFFTGAVISRPEGALFLFYYVAYLAFLVFEAVRSDALDDFKAAMMYVVIPLTGLSLLIATIRYAMRLKEIPLPDERRP